MGASTSCCSSEDAERKATHEAGDSDEALPVLSEDLKGHLDDVEEAKTTHAEDLAPSDTKAEPVQAEVKAAVDVELHAAEEERQRLNEEKTKAEEEEGARQEEEDRLQRKLHEDRERKVEEERKKNEAEAKKRKALEEKKRKAAELKQKKEEDKKKREAEELEEKKRSEKITKMLATAGEIMCEAIDGGKIKPIKELLSWKANPDEIDHEGRIPLMMATFEGHGKIVDMLLEAKADVNKLGKGLGPKGVGGNTTALHICARHGHKSIAESLLKAGADPTIKNERNQTAAGVAEGTRHAEISTLIRKHTQKAENSPRP